MLSFSIGLITVLMVLDCVLLVFLVLLQLPKKEAGAGLAFGGAATDALFGAGSGNVLTKTTKWMAGGFFVFALILAMLSTQRSKSGASALEEELTKKGSTPAASSPNTPPDANLLKTIPTAPQPAPSTPAPAAPLNSPKTSTATPAAPTTPPAEPKK
jgi:preprotein translocase subunit SecG